MLKHYKLDLDGLVVRWRYHEDFPKVLFPNTGLKFGQRVAKFQSNFTVYGAEYASTMALEGKQYPSAAKAYKATRPAHERWDWDQRHTMLLVQRAKFQDPRLLADLMTTVGMELVNDTDDLYWGWADGQGKNWLGKLLMAVRAEAEQGYPDNVLKPAPGLGDTGKDRKPGKIIPPAP